MNRVRWVDALRGLAIVLMVIFHFCYDLRHFGYVDWNIPNGPNWRPFRYVILTLFISTVGISLSLAHGGGVRWRSFGVRLGQLLAASALITGMSFWMFPNGWIYFGILHFITVATLLGILVVRQPLVALALGALVLLLYFTQDPDFHRLPFSLFREMLPSYTEDFVPLFPWLGAMYLGIAVAGLLPIRAFDLPNHVAVNWLPRIGRHGLIIYVVHQPILFGAFFAVDFLLIGG